MCCVVSGIIGALIFSPYVPTKWIVSFGVWSIFLGERKCTAGTGHIYPDCHHLKHHHLHFHLEHHLKQHTIVVCCRQFAMADLRSTSLSMTIASNTTNCITNCITESNNSGTLFCLRGVVEWGWWSFDERVLRNPSPITPLLHRSIQVLTCCAGLLFVACCAASHHRISLRSQ